MILSLYVRTYIKSLRPAEKNLYLVDFHTTVTDSKRLMLIVYVQSIPSDLHFLGAPLTNLSSEIIFNQKLIELQTMLSRLADLNQYTAYVGYHILGHSCSLICS